MGDTDFVSEIKYVENYLILKIQHGLQGYIVKNIECESKEANDLYGSANDPQIGPQMIPDRK